MALPLDDTDIAILCTLLDSGWSTSSDVVAANQHETLSSSASDAVRYRLLRLVDFGLCQTRKAPTVRKRQEFSVVKESVQRIGECAIVEENGAIHAIGKGILVENDFYAHPEVE